MSDETKQTTSSSAPLAPKQVEPTDKPLPPEKIKVKAANTEIAAKALVKKEITETAPIKKGTEAPGKPNKPTPAPLVADKPEPDKTELEVKQTKPIIPDNNKQPVPLSKGETKTTDNLENPLNTDTKNKSAKILSTKKTASATKPAPGPELTPALKPSPKPESKQTSLSQKPQPVTQESFAVKYKRKLLEQLKSANFIRKNQVKKNLNLVLDYARKHQRITNNDVENLTKVKHDQATDYLNKLVKDKKLIRFGSSKNTFYKPIM